MKAEVLTPSQVDSLEAVADRCLADGRSDRAIQLLEGVANQRRDGSSFARLGHVHLAEGRFDIAEMVFEKALSEGKKEDIAEAFYGLGLVNMDLPGGGVSKIGLGVAADYFSEALIRKPGHKDARFRRARARFLMGWAHECREELEEFLKMYPDHVDAVLLMGSCYADLAEEYGKAIIWYTRYLTLCPDNADVERRLGRVYRKLKNYDGMVTSLQSFVDEHPQAIEIMPVIAEVCTKKRKLDLALEVFQRYLSRVDPQDRGLYEDLVLILSKGELADHARTPAEERNQFADRFWGARDPDLSTSMNESLLEHYRRVHYARTQFSAGMKPWDRRGEVYIRFGEPDHRSSSKAANPYQIPAVQRVKRQVALALYGQMAANEHYVGPVYPIRSRMDGGIEEETRASASPGEDTGLGPRVIPGQEALDVDDRLSQYRPVTSGSPDLSRIPWESWVYTKVGGGIEITFTDELQSAVYDFAPLPSSTTVFIDGTWHPGSTRDVDRGGIRWLNLSKYRPDVLYNRAVEVTPHHYAP